MKVHTYQPFFLSKQNRRNSKTCCHFTNPIQNLLPVTQIVLSTQVSTPLTFLQSTKTFQHTCEPFLLQHHQTNTTTSTTDNTNTNATAHSKAPNPPTTQIFCQRTRLCEGTSISFSPLPTLSTLSHHQYQRHLQHDPATTEIYTHLDRDYLKQVIQEYHPRS